MKRVLAVSLLSVFTCAFIINPASAIMDKNDTKEAQQTVLDYVNFDWWKQQNDEYLEKYIVSAIENNHDIKSTSLKIEQAKLNVTMARADQLPTLSIGANPHLGKMPGVTKTDGAFVMPIMTQYELDLFGKNWDKTKSSKKLLQGTIYEAQVADIAIVSMVASTYYNIVKLDKLIEIQEKITKDKEEIYNLMKLSNDEGIVSTADLIQAEKSFVMSQNDLINYQKIRQTALNNLAVLIGDSPNNTNEYQRIKIDELSRDFNIPDTISSDIILNRPDYKSLEKQLESAGLNVRVAKKEFLPTINIMGLLAFLSTSTASSLSYKNALGILSAGTDLVLFSGFRKTANLKLQKNRYAQLLEQYQKAGLVAIQEINDSLYNYKSDNKKLENNKKALEIQEKDFNYSQSKFDEGIISKLDLLQQKETLLYMQKLEASSTADCYIDKISLYKSTGAKI